MPSTEAKARKMKVKVEGKRKTCNGRSGLHVSRGSRRQEVGGRRQSSRPAKGIVDTPLVPCGHSGG